MRTGGIWLLLVLLAATPAFGQDKKPPAAKPKPAAKKAPPPPLLKIHEDGSIETDKAIIRYWQVNHKAPGALAQELTFYKSFLGDDVKFDDKSRGQNILRISAPPEKWPLVSKLLDVLDVPEPQVFVEARIIEIKHDSNLEFGVEAMYDRRVATESAQPFFGKFVGNFNPESYLESLGTGIPWGGGSFEFKTTNERWTARHGEFEYIIRALQQQGSAEILSKPSIIATQGNKATIITGSRFPVQTVTISGNIPKVSTSFEETGIKLEILPVLIGREYVSLDIKAEDSQVTEVIPGPEGSLQPVISNRSAQTQVNVRDGETIIIGGLLTTSTIESKSGLPLLQDIPLLGYLFSSTRTKEVKGELVFFIQPQIIKRSIEQELIVPPSERRRVGEEDLLK